MKLSAMNPMQKVALFGAAAMTLPLIAVGIFIVQSILHAERTASFASIENTKPPLQQADVEKLLGQPATIEETASADQTVTGSVYHYPSNGSDMKVIFVNGVVFKTELVPLTKS
jgi:hypothetical protein